MSDYEDDDFSDETPQRENAASRTKPKTTTQGSATGNTKFRAAGQQILGAGKQKNHNEDMVAGATATMMGMAQRTTGGRKNDHDDPGNGNQEARQDEGQVQDMQARQPVIASWSSILAANDTNKKIIFKFMKKGFTSLSAEELACTMVSSDFSLDFKKNTKEDWMVQYQFKVVERLQKCNFNFKWNTRSSVTTQGMGEIGAFFDLCKSGDTGRVVQYLRQWKGQEDQVMSEVDQINKKTGLHYAVEGCHPQLVEYLLNKGAKVDARDKMLKTPLHIACLKGYSILVRLIVENKGDPFERDFQGRHSLHFACCSASENSAQEIFAILSGDSTDLVHMPDYAGRTPLHYAIFNQFPGQIRMIQQLLMYGANINCIDENRRTPLHFAAMEGRSSIIPLLVQNGAAAGLKDYQQQTPMDLAATDQIRQMIIVYSPYNKFKPTDDDMAALEVEGIPKPIKKVSNMPASYYEPYEHAQPAKKQKKNFRKINAKAVADVPQTEGDNGVIQTCHCQCQPAQIVPPEELCMNCRPLGPSSEWTKQKASSLPYNIRNYQAKLVENLKRVQEFGVESFQHVKKPYLFTGSWMEYVRNMDDLMLQINGVRPNEAVMKVFNILFPYGKPLPRGQGDELGLAGFYSDAKPDTDPNADLKDCHPDKLRDNIMADRENAVGEAIKKNGVDDINDLLHMQQQMTQLQTANEMALVTIEEKDLRIAKLTKENEQLMAKHSIKGAAETTIIALEERIFALQNINKQLESDKTGLSQKMRSLVVELEGANYNKTNAEADARLQEEMLQTRRKIEELELQLLNEKQRNMQLRLKSGQAFMAALNDPNFASTGGKIVDEVYDPEDDKALIRLLTKIKEMGEASLDEKLNTYCDGFNYINKTQFDGMLKYHDTAVTDYIRMNRIAGFAHLKTDVKKMKVADVMYRINNRAAMKEQNEDKTLRHIAIYMDKQDWSIDQLFRNSNTDEDETLSDTELFAMLDKLHINVNQQLQRMLYAMFDADKSGTISKEEFKAKLSPYTKKAAITAEQIGGTIIAQKDKEELAEMFNEENRDKAVFEDFGFSPSDKDELAHREAETIALIKKGELLMEEMKGEVQIKLLDFENLTRVEGKPVVFYKLKRTYFTAAPEVAVAFRKDKSGFMQKNFSWESSRMDLRINLNDYENENLHMQGDTILIELFMIEAPDVKLRKTATSVGEIRFNYKHCFKGDQKNTWLHQQIPITSKNPGRADELLSGQINVEVRYQEAHMVKKRQNIPQELIQVEEKHDKMAQHVGEAGTLHIAPMQMTFEAGSSLTWEADPTQYGILFSMVNDPSRNITSDKGEVEQDPACCRWMDSRQMAVNDTLVDKLINCTLVKLTAIGEKDVPVASGQVPQTKLADIYSKVDMKQTSSMIEMKNTQGQKVGAFKVKIMLSSELLKGAEEQKDDEMVPAGNLAAASQQ